LKYRHSNRRTNFRKNGKALEGILIDRIQIDNMTLLLQDSTGKDTTSIVKGLFDIRDVAFYKRNDSLKWLDADIKVNDLTMQSPHGLYQYLVKSGNLNVGNQVLRIDSVKINPVHNKQAFMRAAGFETDRMDGLISHLEINGLEFMDYPKSIRASTVETRYQLKIFHDKRYPSRPPVVKTLPAHFIQRLPFALSCDTIYIKDSYISYEEFPIKGDSSGFIVFSHLNATLTGVHNNPSRHSDVIMNISAKFMDQGDLTAKFTFPYDTTKSYSTTGTLRNFVLKNANPMLVPAARARIESGLLTALKFHFLYNNYESDGEVELNYQDLKISSLHQNKDHEPAINHIKTFLLNALIIKKNRNEDTNSEKRKGTIQYHRDPHKAIFNYWWKSILSGIKSAYKLDKIPSFAKKDQKKK
jgi:hypothetical protein